MLSGSSENYIKQLFHPKNMNIKAILKVQQYQKCSFKRVDLN